MDPHEETDESDDFFQAMSDDFFQAMDYMARVLYEDEEKESD